MHGEKEKHRHHYRRDIMRKYLLFHQTFWEEF